MDGFFRKRGFGEGGSRDSPARSFSKYASFSPSVAMIITLKMKKTSQIYRVVSRLRLHSMFTKAPGHQMTVFGLFQNNRLHGRSTFSASGGEENLSTLNSVIELDRKFMLNLYPKNDNRLLFTHGEGCYLFSNDGKKFLDGFSGIAVGALGHSDPELVEVMRDQVGKMVRLMQNPTQKWLQPLINSLSF